jgi:hypothetical protein
MLCWLNTTSKAATCIPASMKGSRACCWKRATSCDPAEVLRSCCSCSWVWHLRWSSSWEHQNDMTAERTVTVFNTVLARCQLGRYVKGCAVQHMCCQAKSNAELPLSRRIWYQLGTASYWHRRGTTANMHCGRIRSARSVTTASSPGGQASTPALVQPSACIPLCCL